MNKKGQIYLIAAIILAVVVFAVASVTNIAKQDKFKGDFEKLSQNYETEGTKLINTVVNKGADVGGTFGNFTYAFTAYSKTQNPQFELIYLLDYKEEVHIGNYLTDEINIIYKNSKGKNELKELVGCFGAVNSVVTFGDLTATFTSATNQDLGECMTVIPEPSDKMVYISIKDYLYPFEVVPNKPQLMIVSKMEQEEQTKVFIGGEGFIEIEHYPCSYIEDKDFCDLLKPYGCKWEEGKCQQKLKFDKGIYKWLK